MSTHSPKSSFKTKAAETEAGRKELAVVVQTSDRPPQQQQSTTYTELQIHQMKQQGCEL